MYAQYGSYVHDANTCTLSQFLVRQLYSPRHARYATMYSVTLNGQLIVNDASITTPSALQAAQYSKISALINAYSQNYQDFKFIQDDGTVTRHSLINANSLSGVQVVHRSWPQGDGAEYATLRSYTIILQALYDEEESELFDYQEYFHYIGNCGPRWTMDDTWDGPVYQMTYPATHQKMIQTGSAVGWKGYPLVHINSFYPQWEHTDRRVVSVGHPQRFANGFRMFPVQWKMEHSLPTYNQGVPIMR